MLEDLNKLFRRDLEATQREILLYPDNASVWKELPGCPNPGGNLALHIIGNLRHYVGAQLGESGYLRKRDEEFSRRDLTRGEIAALLSQTVKEIDDALSSIDEDALNEASLAPIGEATMSTRLWLMHLAGHLSYHLGQLNYHRRILTGDTTSAGGSSLQALVSG